MHTIRIIFGSEQYTQKNIIPVCKRDVIKRTTGLIILYITFNLLLSLSPCFLLVVS